ncbi:hypothetical protein HK102_010094, partial [Quaeritorhiza haematococci]
MLNTFNHAQQIITQFASSFIKSPKSAASIVAPIYQSHVFPTAAGTTTTGTNNDLTSPSASRIPVMPSRAATAKTNKSNTPTTTTFSSTDRQRNGRRRRSATLDWAEEDAEYFDAVMFPFTGREGTAKNNLRKKKRSVSFNETVTVMLTFGPGEYDRTSIQVSPLTHEDIDEILRMRDAFRRETEALHLTPLSFPPSSLSSVPEESSTDDDAYSIISAGMAAAYARGRRGGVAVYTDSPLIGSFLSDYDDEEGSESYESYDDLSEEGSGVGWQQQQETRREGNFVVRQPLGPSAGCGGLWDTMPSFNYHYISASNPAA